MGQLIDEAQKAYDDFWNTLKSSDLTTVDMNAAMVQKTTLEVKIDKAKEQESVFEVASSTALETFDADMKTQLETKRAELAALESSLSSQRTVIETLWQKKRVDGKYDVNYTIPSE